MRYCPQCGEEVVETDDFCFSCGTRLAGGQSGQVSSMGTVWITAGLAVLAAVESAVLLVTPGQVLAQAEEIGLEAGLSEAAVMLMGGIGIVLALSVGALSVFYYQQGYVERRFFYGLLAAGAVGVLGAGGISFLLLLGVGLYGRFVLLR